MTQLITRYLFAAILITLLLFNFSCGSLKSGQGPNIESPHKPLATTWKLTPVSPPKGVVILLPGLNTDPDAMLPLASFFQSSGFHSVVLRYLNLGGTSPAGSYSDWENYLAQLQGRIESTFGAIPQFIVGYSLGGLIATHGLSEDLISANAMVLLSPAIELRERSYLIGFLTWLRFFNLSLPSKAPVDYRDRAFTPFDSYHQLLLLQSMVSEEVKRDSLIETPTLMIFHQDDELINSTRLKSWILRQKLNWNYLELTGELNDETLLHHITLDERSLGKKDWELVTRSMLHLFLQSKYPR